MRYLIGTIIAPLVPVVIVTLFNLASGLSVGEGVPIAALWSYLGAVVLGIPAFLICRKRRWLRWWQLALAGIVAGTLAPLLQASGLVIFAVIGGASLSGVTALLPVVVTCAAVGGSIALAFWAIARPSPGGGSAI